MTALRNFVALVGRMTKDPEERKTNSDIPVCNFSLAVDRPGTNKDNRITDFFDCVAWRGTAQNIHKFFHKGDPIGIVGNLQTSEYTDKDGNKRKKVEVCVDSFEFMPAKKDGGGTAQEESTAAEPEAVGTELPEDPDKLPF